MRLFRDDAHTTRSPRDDVAGPGMRLFRDDATHKPFTPRRHSRPGMRLFRDDTHTTRSPRDDVAGPGMRLFRDDAHTSRSPRDDIAGPGMRLFRDDAHTTRSPRVAPMLHRRVSRGAHRVNGCTDIRREQPTSGRSALHPLDVEGRLGGASTLNSVHGVIALHIMQAAQIPHLRHSRERGNPSRDKVRHHDTGSSPSLPPAQSGGESKAASLLDI